jgi:lipopolysaccharide/colanic/teichoic acid biosynthesis glycosyltransferase
MTRILDPIRMSDDTLILELPRSTPRSAGAVAWSRDLYFGGGDDARLRRALNFVTALVALTLLSPVMLLIALLIRLSSPGPVIYKQTRVGVDRRNYASRAFDSRRQIDYGGRLFTIYKFRTMRSDPDTKLQIWASANDARITGIGRVLRKYRLDELPQLFNVLRGDMNIVGPRPEQPNIFVELREQVPGYRLRQRVLPGITGWAQINHHYDQCIEDVEKKVRYDLEYLARKSVLLDVAILAKTLPVMIFRRGAL